MLCFYLCLFVCLSVCLSARLLESYEGILINFFDMGVAIAPPLTPKHVTLNDLEWPFCVKSCFAPVRLEL